MKHTTLELCAGAGGQALGLEQAGFEHAALVELDKHACQTLRMNRPNWNVIQADIREFDGGPHRGVDLVAFLSARFNSGPGRQSLLFKTLEEASYLCFGEALAV